ncbi:MAG: hypothetical protein DRQ37_02300 [Gammaproteobacteria bacterium]|nr:MAG: hypothetical protein DRQ37_02300 [Gammaproteobacteria bacterium]
MKRYIPRSLYILLVTGLVLTTAAWAQDKPPARVVVAPVGEQTISQSASMEGIVHFERVADLSAEVSGRIDEHHLQEGRLVETGQPLVTINTDFVRKDIEITKKEREQVEAEIKKLESNLQRLTELLKTNAASRSAYDDARYSHQALERKREKLSAQISRLRLQADKAVVRAPFNGIVLERFTELGEWTGPGTPVARVASVDDVVVKVAVSENLLRYLVTGEKITLTIPALREELTGTIHGLTPVADLRSRSVSIKIQISHRPQMVQNMSAKVEIPIGEKMVLRTIRRDAVIKLKGKDFVYTIEEDKAKILPVNIVSRMGELVAVDNPYITVGMPIIVDGNDRLKPGQPVQVVDN